MVNLLYKFFSSPKTFFSSPNQIGYNVLIIIVKKEKLFILLSLFSNSWIGDKFLIFFDSCLNKIYLKSPSKILNLSLSKRKKLLSYSSLKNVINSKQIFK